MEIGTYCLMCRDLISAQETEPIVTEAIKELKEMGIEPHGLAGLCDICNKTFQEACEKPDDWVKRMEEKMK